MNFLKSGDKKRLLREAEEIYGIGKLDFPILLVTGKQKIRVFSGSMSKDEIRELSGIANVEIVGAYVFKQDEKFGLRISMDGTKILSEEIKKNVIEINQEEMKEWLCGKNLEVVRERGVYVVKHGDDFLGCGISDGKKIINYVPKERRVRKG